MPAKKSTKRTRVKTTRTTPKKGDDLPSVINPLKDKALAAYATAGTVKGACAAIGIHRATWYDWIEKDPEFGAKVLAAHEDVTDDLELEAIQRAKDGSDTLIIFLLKSRRPGQYREKQEITVVHADVQARLARQVAVITGRATWDSNDLLDALNEVWT